MPICNDLRARKGHFADCVGLGNALDRAFAEAESLTLARSDRQHWAFQAPVEPDPPDVKDPGTVWTAIDLRFGTAVQKPLD